MERRVKQRYKKHKKTQVLKMNKKYIPCFSAYIGHVMNSMHLGNEVTEIKVELLI